MNPPTSTSGPVARGRLWLGGLGLAAVARLWIMPLGSSLSLDEFGTWWVTDGGFGQILARARIFPQSVLYAGIIGLTRAVAGPSELALRLPSLAAALLAAFCLYRLGNELFDGDAGLLAVAIFVGVPQVCFAAGDARPYAFALLATIAALWLLARWLEGGRAADAAGYVLCAAAMVYFQYLFAAMLVAHAAYAFRRWRRGCGVTGRQLLLAAGAIALLTVPASLLTLEIARDRAIHDFAVMPDVKALALTLVPSGILVALAGSAFACWAGSRLAGVGVAPAGQDATPEHDAAPLPSDDALWLLCLSVLVPAVLLFGVSRVGGTSVFVARYMLCILPCQALLLAWLLRWTLPIAGGRAVVAGYLVIMLLARGTKVAHSNDDWRGAVGAVGAVTGRNPVLLSGSYAESRNVAWVQDGEHAAYMLAPLEYYPPRGQTMILPLLAGPDAESYAQRLLDAGIASTKRFSLIERSSRWPSWAPWLDRRLRPRGYRMRRVWDSGSTSAWVFERSAPAARDPG